MADSDAGNKKSGCGGCFKAAGIGCLTVVLLLGVGGFFAYSGIKKKVVQLTAEYTEPAPAALPAVQVTEAESAALFQRVEGFSKAIESGASAQELTLTAQDLNVLIQKSPDLADKVRVAIEGDQLQGTVCIPLDDIGSLFKGRWLNGEVTFRVDTAAAGLMVFLDDLKVRGKPLPPQVMQVLRDKNLAEKAGQDPKAAAVLQKLQSVSVRDGKLVIKAKPSLGQRSDN